MNLVHGFSGFINEVSENKGFIGQFLWSGRAKRAFYQWFSLGDQWNSREGGFERAKSVVRRVKKRQKLKFQEHLRLDEQYFWAKWQS